jgi:zinc resistance-associated protein
MKMRYAAIGLVVAAMLTGGAASALAGPRHGGWRGGPPPCGGDAFYGVPYGGASNPEQEAALAALFQKHEQAVEPLRQQLYAKHLELEALADNPNAKPETITGLSREIARMDGELRKANREFREELRKDRNITLPPYAMGPYRDYGRHPGRCR